MLVLQDQRILLEEVKTSYFNKNNIIDSSNEIYYELIKNFNTNYFDNNGQNLGLKKITYYNLLKTFFLILCEC